MGSCYACGQEVEGWTPCPAGLGAGCPGEDSDDHEACFAFRREEREEKAAALKAAKAPVVPAVTVPKTRAERREAAARHMLDYEQMNPGIRDVVIFLRDNGFTTCDSGDGATRDHDCDLPLPYVHMQIPRNSIAVEVERLAALMMQRGIEPYNRFGMPRIEANYAPGRDFAILSLYHVTSATLMDPVAHPPSGEDWGADMVADTEQWVAGVDMGKFAGEFTEDTNLPPTSASAASAEGT